jgi:hypothetical protein
LTYVNPVCSKVVVSSHFWFTDFKKYLSSRKNVSDWREVVDDDDGRYRLYLSDFFFSPEGAANKVKLTLYDDGEEGEDLKCSQDMPKYKVQGSFCITRNPLSETLALYRWRHRKIIIKKLVGFVFLTFLAF